MEELNRYQRYYRRNRARKLEYCKKYYQKHRAKYLSYGKKYYSSHRLKHLEYSKTYREKNKEKIREYYKDWYIKNGRNRSINYIEKTYEWQKLFPHKYKAHLMIVAAIKEGKIRRPNKCEKCKRTTKTNAHHANYNKPLLVQWLCASCHKLEHTGKNS